MLHTIRYLSGALFLLALLASAPGQEKAADQEKDKGKAAEADKAGAEKAADVEKLPGYKPQFYKQPETSAEFWKYLKHEIELGHFDLAAAYLKGFIAKNPTDEELLQIQERDGSSAFYRLLTIPQLRKDAKPLVERVDAVVQKHLRDRQRLDKLIKNLNATPEERDYAIAQLRRSGAAAIPAVVDALIRTANEPDEHAAILSALRQLGSDTSPPLLAALDVNEGLRVELIDVLQRRAEKRAVPYLYALYGSPKQPDFVRRKALEALLGLEGVKTPDRLRPVKTALTAEAERYYQHQAKFVDPGAVTIWSWDGSKLESKVLPSNQAEEYYGLYFAGKALEIDPTFVPAQLVYLSLLLDNGSERPGVKDVLRSVNPELIIAVLERALSEQRQPVILGAVSALGALAEVRATRPSGQRPPVLLTALNYPDRRVQVAAADAVLRIAGPPLAPSRVIEILRRTLAGEPEAQAKPKVLVAFADQQTSQTVSAAVQQAGYEAVVVRTGREALRRLNEAGDIDVILVDAGLPDPGLSSLLAQLRADVNVGLVPLLVTVPGGHETSVRLIIERYNDERRRLEMSREFEPTYAREGRPDPRQVNESAYLEDSLQRLAKRYNDESTRIEDSLRRQTGHYRNVTVLPIADAQDGKRIGHVLKVATASVASRPLSNEERKDSAQKALEWLARIGRGEIRGYDIRPAEGAILKALHSTELAPMAVEVAGRLPGQAPQRELATVVLDGDRPPALRSAAAIELCRHVQQHGAVLTDNQVKGLKDLFDRLKDDPKLKANVALVLGSLRPDARQTGDRLQRFTPSFSPPEPPAAPPAAPKENKEKKEKDADADK
jgi:CheY-like chemotaxis protein